MLSILGAATNYLTYASNHFSTLATQLPLTSASPDTAQSPPSPHVALTLIVNVPASMKVLVFPSNGLAVLFFCALLLLFFYFLFLEVSFFSSLSLSHSSWVIQNMGPLSLPCAPLLSYSGPPNRVNNFFSFAFSPSVWVSIAAVALLYLHVYPVSLRCCDCFRARSLVHFSLCSQHLAESLKCC